MNVHTLEDARQVDKKARRRVAPFFRISCTIDTLHVFTI